MLYIQSAAAAKSLQLWSDSVRSHRQQPTRIPRPWDSLGKNTGVGYIMQITLYSIIKNTYELKKNTIIEM